MKRLMYICLLLLAGYQAPAQNKVIVEAIRSFSMFGPSMYYLEDPYVQQTIQTRLGAFLRNHYNLDLVNEPLPVIVYTDPESLINKKVTFKTNDTSTWHLFIELYEYDPKIFLAGVGPLLEDTAILLKSQSVIQLTALLTNPKTEIVNNQNIYTAISTIQSSGGGISPKNVFLTKKSFVSLVNVGLEVALDSSNQTELIEIKAPPVYYADNFILKQLKNSIKTEIKENKGVWQFNLNEIPEVLRMGEQIFDEIWVKRKLIDSSATPLLLSKIKETGNTASSDFIYLRQECRDVYLDKNYTIKLATEIDPYSLNTSKKEIFTNFLPGLVNMMLLGKDTVAVFGILKGVSDPNKQVYLDKTTNGIDSSSMAKVSKKDFPLQITYDYQLIGKIRGEQFTINSFWNHEMRELYVNNQLVCIVKGKVDPENFIRINGYDNTEMIKELILIAYNKFLL